MRFIIQNLLSKFRIIWRGRSESGDEVAKKIETHIGAKKQEKNKSVRKAISIDSWQSFDFISGTIYFKIWVRGSKTAAQLLERLIKIYPRFFPSIHPQFFFRPTRTYNDKIRVELIGKFGNR